MNDQDPATAEMLRRKAETHARAAQVHRDAAKLQGGHMREHER
jgi:hypothetical protein